MSGGRMLSGRILPACTDGRPKCARMINSLPPWNCLIFQTRHDRSGLYETEPLLLCIDRQRTCLFEDSKVTLNLGVSASSGTGTSISTLFAVLLRLNWARALTRYSTREPE